MVLMPRAKLGKKSRRRSGSSATSKSTVRRAVAGTATISKSVARRPPQSLVLTVGKTSQALPVFHGTLSVIISARNEEETLQRLLKQVARLKPTEIIVVLNGCRDSSFERARLSRQAIVVHCPDSAGHDVGRAIGAKLSRGDILLFLDGDMVIPAPQLASFAAAVDGGVDVALNDLDSLLPPFGSSDDVIRCKLFLNFVLGRSDLGVSSMTAVPHALSRHALESIGYRELMVPPKAQAIAILNKLRVEKTRLVNVIKHNRLRPANTGVGNPVEKLIVGDHAEALFTVLSQRATSNFLHGESLQEQRRQLALWRNGL